jgi:hypothetical protein
MKEICLMAIAFLMWCLLDEFQNFSKMYKEHQKQHQAIDQKLLEFQGYFNNVSMMFEKEARDRGSIK